MIVALDGAATDLSVAVADADGRLRGEDAWTGPGRQSAELLPRLLELLARSGIAVHEVTALAVGLGPGSFTGLRVSLALAKGLAVGLGRPIVGIPSLEAWLDAEPDAEAAVARAGAREAYLLRRDQPVTVADREQLVVAGPIVAPAELAAAFGLHDARPPRGAPAIARRGAERLEGEGRGDPLDTLEPIYLRGPRGVPDPPAGATPWP
jgi:tRNA threonylcarbamoyladenosine biosynthesis protein TsaB